MSPASAPQPGAGPDDARSLPNRVAWREALLPERLCWAPLTDVAGLLRHQRSTLGVEHGIVEPDREPGVYRCLHNLVPEIGRAAHVQ